MSANAALVEMANAFDGIQLVPSLCEAPALDEETDGLSGTSAESLRLAKGFMTAIDFEVAAAHCLSLTWHAERYGDVYLNRSLERISEHMKALKVIHAALRP